MSLRWYAEERRRTRTFDSPPVDHDFESFRIIFCALRDAEISASFLPPFALTHANYAPSGNRVPFFSPSLFFSKRADDRWECRRPSLWKTTRLNISVRNPFQDAPTLVRSSRLEASIQVQGPIRLGCPRSADRYYDH